jgi:hypothetical protein
MPSEEPIGLITGATIVGRRPVQGDSTAPGNRDDGRDRIVTTREEGAVIRLNGVPRRLCRHRRRAESNKDKSGQSRMHPNPQPDYPAVMRGELS